MKEISFCILTTSYPKWNEKPGEFIQGKFVHDMAKSLVRAGIRTYVVAPHGAGTPALSQVDGVVIHRFRYLPARFETLTQGAGIPENIKKFRNKVQVPFFFFAMMIKTARVVVRNDVKVINAHWIVPTGFVGLVLRTMLRRFLVVTAYGAEVFPVLKGRMHYLRPFIRLTIRHADVVAAISRETAHSANRLSDCERTHLIPDGIDTAYYIPGPKNQQVLTRYGAKSGEKVIFFTGRMVERKGHQTLLEAMKLISYVRADVRLILGGRGPLFDVIQSAMHEWMLDKCVSLPGFIEEADIVPLLQSIDLFVLPSCVDQFGDTEGSATAALEAMACGTPALISKVGGNVGAIEEGRGAYYFEPRNAQNLADIALRIIESEPEQEQLKRLARPYIIEHFSWESVIGRYITLIQNKHD